MIQLFAFYYFINEWVKDKDTEIKFDTKKMGIIRNNIELLVTNYAKKEGYNAFEILVEEAKKYNFAFLPQDEKIELQDTCEFNILKSVTSKLLETCTQCDMCKRQDFRYCEIFSAKKILKSKQVNNKKKDCPFRNNIENIFNFD